MYLGSSLARRLSGSFAYMYRMQLLALHSLLSAFVTLVVHMQQCAHSV